MPARMESKSPLNETQQELRLTQARADIAHFVSERTATRDALRRVQGAYRQESKLLEPKEDPPSRKRPRPEPQTNEEQDKPSPAPKTDKPEQTEVTPESDGKVEESSPDNSGNNQMDTNDGAEEEETPTSSPGPTGPVAKRPKIELDDFAKKRTANLFGHLMGHLKKAKARLDSEKDTRAAELQQETNRRVEEKLEKEKTALAVARLQSLKEQESSLQEKLRHIQWELSCRETLCLRYELELHYTMIQGFIKTAAEPTLFWMPRMHNRVTRVLQQETAAQIEKKIRSLQEQLKPLSFEEWKIARGVAINPTSPPPVTTPASASATTAAESVVNPHPAPEAEPEAPPAAVIAEEGDAAAAVGEPAAPEQLQPELEATVSK
eukprot:Protomagalhaensia_sp_Gyna_25__5774@NODE_842_length_2521_cov_412_135375_g664_i0_p1_GENE_NODE_842_length_2521_cov_412_135375_g664_i0NODE_842_length_2521_cov_412_135375_g664_i0_p1_ORF_typecomplete_len379_score81_49Pinin_SDK_memA/PF04696_13/1_8e03Pinin_SDK_memA/PF04696_13/1_2e16YlqD/PF11068_8/70YlqD/PF11068_8/0_14LIN52/PF10044_9/42LIN52/PF10044_9/1_6GIT_CC/PF16559_5/2_3GIT_CC/PF16559_5/10DUF5398/PF17376_2/14DUF5398/PF17376_2/67Exonuc_VII_L/PF02601_15/1e03Exonuc_VII_L/PF02601_15/0_049_NODE_842_length